MTNMTFDECAKAAKADVVRLYYSSGRTGLSESICDDLIKRLRPLFDELEEGVHLANKMARREGKRSDNIMAAFKEKQATITKQVETIGQLRGLFDKYGQHQPLCPKDYSSDRMVGVCRCGYDTEMDALADQPGEEEG